MKLDEKWAKPVWVALKNTFELADDIARANNLTGPFGSFKNLVNILEGAEIQQATGWLTYFLENNHQDAVTALDVGMRCVISSLKHNEPLFVNRIMKFQPFVLRDQIIVLTSTKKGHGDHRRHCKGEPDRTSTDGSHYRLG